MFTVGEASLKGGAGLTEVSHLAPKLSLTSNVSALSRFIRQIHVDG